MIRIDPFFGLHDVHDFFSAEAIDCNRFGT